MSVIDCAGRMELGGSLVLGTAMAALEPDARCALVFAPGRELSRVAFDRLRPSGSHVVRLSRQRRCVHDCGRLSGDRLSIRERKVHWS